jgi:hypothetical protein
VKQPRFKIELEVTWNEYLGLLWCIDGTSREHLPYKQTVRKIAKYEKEIEKAHREWAANNFFCAGKPRPLARTGTRSPKNNSQKSANPKTLART